MREPVPPILAPISDRAVLVGLKSRVSQDGMDGYEIGLDLYAVDRLQAIAGAYHLGRAREIVYGPGSYSRLEAGYLARELRDLAVQSRDEGLIAACEALADLADRVKSSSDPAEELLVQVP